MPIPARDPARIARCRRLRRELLQMAVISAQTAATGGWTRGYVIRDLTIDPDSGVGLSGENELAIELLRDLVRKGLIEERPAADKPLHAGERFTLAHCEFRPLERGARLLAELEPIDPEIADMRVEVRP
jgi:hypothetical protein